MDVELVQRAKNAIEANPAFAAQLVGNLQPAARRHFMRLVRTDSALAEEFRSADTNSDGQLSEEEFKAWIMQGSSAATRAEPAVTRAQLKATALFVGIPMVGFGFMDNLIMIIAGDAIDASIGVTFGLSTLCAAGFGNLISDVAGLGLGGYIEASADKIGITNPKLSHAQAATRPVVYTRAAANVVGIAVGCLFGMFPLMFIDEERRALKAMFDELDAGGNGKISREELREGLSKVGLRLSDQSVDEFLDAVSDTTRCL
eukprot:COSAG01_NODE_362_length_18130_cov_34.672307_8_plen_259_part_00